MSLEKLHKTALFSFIKEEKTALILCICNLLFCFLLLSLSTNDYFYYLEQYQQEILKNYTSEFHISSFQQLHKFVKDLEEKEGLEEIKLTIFLKFKQQSITVGSYVRTEKRELLKIPLNTCLKTKNFLFGEENWIKIGEKKYKCKNIEGDFEEDIIISNLDFFSMLQENLLFNKQECIVSCKYCDGIKKDEILNLQEEIEKEYKKKDWNQDQLEMPSYIFFFKNNVFLILLAIICMVNNMRIAYYFFKQREREFYIFRLCGLKNRQVFFWYTIEICFLVIIVCLAGELIYCFINSMERLSIKQFLVSFCIILICMLGTIWSFICNSSKSLKQADC